MSLDKKKLFDYLNKEYDDNIIPVLEEYVKIPNQSPYFDPEWDTNGFLDQAVELIANWIRKQNVSGLTLEVVKSEGKTPLIYVEVEGTDKTQETVLLYGHLDKQPPLTEAWLEGLGPYTPVIRDGKLYGRGASDDGYAAFAAISSLVALKLQGVPHARSVILIEACEESGSPDLPFYVDLLSSRIGTPSLIVCLDSGSGNYEQFWLTTSLRGMVSGDLTVKILNEGIHSGAATGIVPSSFRIMRMLLSRVEDEQTGRIKPECMYIDIPEKRVTQANSCAQALGDLIYNEMPFVNGAGPISKDLTELLLNKAWRPSLAVTGAEGWPNLLSAGNVLRPFTSLKLSFRIPPNVDCAKVQEELKKIFQQDPPYGAEVVFKSDKSGNGWEAPALADWLESAIDEASSSFFNKPANYLGEGGSIPFMGMLGKKYPKAQFVVTGVLGPQSNAHGPNEFLHIDFTKRVTACVATVLAKHYVQFVGK